MSGDDKLQDIKWNAQQDDGQVMLSFTWEMFVLGLALLSIVNLALLVLVNNADIILVITFMDGIIISVFLLDLIRRLYVADDIRAYLTKGWGWVDAISIIPLLRVARLLRVVRVMRVTKRMGGMTTALKLFFKDRAAGGLILVLLIALLVLEFGALMMLWAERGAEGATILTAEDSIWYMIVTMSTVGYGDMSPVTTAGRSVGILIIVVGVGVFGTITGFLANVFLSPSSDSNESETSVVVDAPTELERAAVAD